MRGKRALFLILVFAVILPTKARAASSFLPKPQPGFAATPEAAKFEQVCNSVRLEDAKKIKLDAMEKRLLCGDDKDDLVGKPWAHIPPNQAAYFLLGFLQNRGYHEPEFLQDGDTLFARTGPVSRLQRFRVAGGPPTWDPPQRRLVNGQELTPSLLDDLQGWSLEQIKNEGYACATASSRADPTDGEALVTLKPNKLRYINGFEDAGDSGLAKGVLDRYNAYEPGDLYREYLVALTRKRTQDDGILQTYIVTTKCDPEGVTIVRDVVLGPSRTLSFGAGYSTDLGPIVRGRLRESRIGETASSAQAQFKASFLSNIVNDQMIELRGLWHYSVEHARSYIEPRLKYEHDGELAYNNTTATASLQHGWTKEFADGQTEYRVGPTFIDSKITMGPGPHDVSATFLDTSFRWTSHQFEYFSTSPRTGENFQANFFFADHDAGAEFTAGKLQLQGEKLWDIMRDDPPLLILGVRFNLVSVLGSSVPANALPLNFVTFLGGDGDLRGFDPTSLPSNGVGSMSAFTVSGEARLHKVIWRRADAFGFVDAGVLGGEDFALTHPYLMSPGVGVRYESPIGVFRLYVAQRFALAEDPGTNSYGHAFRFGITFGQEF